MAKNKEIGLLNKKKELMTKINNSNQTQWAGIVIAILLFWTIIGLIIGLVIAVVGNENKSKYKKQLIDIEWKLEKLKIK